MNDKISDQEKGYFFIRNGSTEVQSSPFSCLEHGKLNCSLREYVHPAGFELSLVS